MSNKTYTSFTRDEFEQALSKSDYTFKRVDYDWSMEQIYEHASESGTFVLRVYSSLDKRTGEARSKGSDAIRTVVLHAETERPVLKERRTNRIGTWEKNLIKKINSLSQRQDEIIICDNCSSAMVIRESSSGDKFYGCSSYPDCENTKSIQ
jgi:Topoisomerase DNA binding C4 zinc finger.